MSKTNRRLNFEKPAMQRNASKKINKQQYKDEKLCREYIKFILNSGYSKNIERIKNYEKMLDDVGFLYVKERNILEDTFNKCVNFISKQGV